MSSGSAAPWLLEFPLAFDDAGLSVPDDAPDAETFPGVELIALDAGDLLLAAHLLFPDGQGWDAGEGNGVDLYLGDGSGYVASFASGSLASGPGNGSGPAWDETRTVIQPNAPMLRWKGGSLYAVALIANGSTLASGMATLQVLILP